MHGERVMVGLVIQLILEGYPEEEIRRVISFGQAVGLPVSVADLFDRPVEEVTAAELSRIRQLSLSTTTDLRKIGYSFADPAEEPEAETLIEEVVRDRERSRILYLCMGRLHTEYREALYLTYFEGLRYAEAAEVIGKSVKQITNMVYRGKQSLRELLEQEGITHAEQ